MGFGTVLDASKLNSKGTGFHEDGRGNHRYDEIGYNVVACGDVNGDGLQDHMMGGYRDGKQVAYVVFGSKSYKATTHPETDLNGHNGFTITRNATEPYTVFSPMNEAIGDMNQDGFADVAMSYRSHGTYVVFGGPSLPKEVDVGDLDGTNGFFLQGTGHFLLGYSVAGGGDINGDGISDLVVSAAEVLFVLFGNRTGFNATVHVEDLYTWRNNGFRIDAVDSGYPDVSVADVTADGYADILVTGWSTAPYDPHYGINDAVFMVRGRKSPLFREPFSLAEDASSEIACLFPGSTCRYVSAVGDVDNDGVGDFGLATRRHQAYVVFGVGTTEGLPPFTDLETLIEEGGASMITYNGGTEVFDNFATQITAAGDLDGDGIDDVILNTGDLWCCNRKGDAYVIFGRPRNEWPKNLHAKNLQVGEGFRVDNIYRTSTWSWNSVAGIGDCNGDGLDDAVVATIEGKGRANIIFGRRDNERAAPDNLDDAGTSFVDAEAEVDELLAETNEITRLPQDREVPRFAKQRMRDRPTRSLLPP